MVFFGPVGPFFGPGQENITTIHTAGDKGMTATGVYLASFLKTKSHVTSAQYNTGA